MSEGQLPLLTSLSLVPSVGRNANVKKRLAATLKVCVLA